MAVERDATPDSKRTQLSDLIERYIAERITESECERLNALLEENAENKEFFRRQLDTHFLLREILDDDSDERSVSGIIEWCALRAFTVTEQSEPRSPSKAAERPRDRHTFVFKWIAVPTILVAMVFGIYSEFFHRRASIPKYENFAQITDTIDVQWGEGNPVFKPGANIGNEFIRFDRGIVKIRIQNGAELILEGPTEFIVSGKLRTFCQKGKVNAVVPKTARGFELSTPFSRVVDLGTEFSVVVDDDAAEVHMLEGKAEVSRDRNSRVPLSAGKALRTPKTGDTEPLTLDHSVCLRNDVFEKLLVSFLTRRTEIRETRNKRLVVDPDILCRFDGEDFQGVGRGVLHGGKRIHWANRDRTATRFQGMRDRIELDVPGEHTSLTLLMMVRIHSLNHVSRLLIGDDYYERPGTLLWQLDPSGNVQFRIHSAGKEKFPAFDVPEGFQRKDFGTWTLLAVTVDAENRIIRHYKDGVAIAEIPWRNPQPLRLENMSVGNESRRSNKRFKRFLDADIAESQVYRRVLDTEEIKKIYDDIF